MLLKATEKHCCSFKAVIVCLLVSFSLMSVVPAQALAQGVFSLPTPGTVVSLSPGFVPVMLRGLQVNLANPFQFDFIVDSGNTGLEGDALKAESEKLARYFLATLTTPEEDLWVNLSPYENNRVIPEELGQTQMGQELLAQDYILKQITASLILPDSKTGKIFWDKVYKKAYEEYGATSIPTDTFNKVWIVPERAVVYEDVDRAVITESHLKVMLEEDYLAAQESQKSKVKSQNETQPLNTNDQILTASPLSSQIAREVLIPLLEKEVNEGRNFAQLRQMFHAMVLATWYKQALKESIINKVYADKKKVEGLELVDSREHIVSSNDQPLNTNDHIPNTVQSIYDQYLAAYKKGVCDLVRVEQDPHTHKPVARKYFSGGFGRPGGKPISSAITRKPWAALTNSLARFIAGTAFAVAMVLGSPDAGAASNSTRPSMEQAEEKVKTEIENKEQDEFGQAVEMLRDRVKEFRDPSSWNQDFFSKENLLGTVIAGLLIVAAAGLGGSISFRSVRKRALKRITQDIKDGNVNPKMFLKDNALFLSSGRVQIAIDREQIRFGDLFKLNIKNDDRRYFVSLLWLLPFFVNKNNPDSPQMKDFIWSCFGHSMTLPQKFYRRDIEHPFFQQEPLLDRNIVLDFFVEKMIEYPELRTALQERFADIRPNFYYHTAGNLLDTSDRVVELAAIVAREIREGKKDYEPDLLFLDYLSKFFYHNDRSPLILGTFFKELFPQDQDVVAKLLNKLRAEYKYSDFLGEIPAIGIFAIKNKEIIDNNASLIKAILSQESNVRGILGSHIASHHNFTQKEFNSFLEVFLLNPEANDIIADVLFGWYKRRSESFILPKNLQDAMQELKSGVAQTEHLLESPRYLLANYFLLGDLIAENKKEGMISERVNFSQLKEFIKDFFKAQSDNISSFNRIGENDLLNLRAVAYEAFLMWEQIINVQQKAQELDLEVVVVANLSYGGVALAPITDQKGSEYFIRGTNIPVWRTKVGSTEAHNNEYVLPEDLFSPDQLRFLVEKKPMVIVVDGSTSVADKNRTSAHIPDGFKGYRNFFIAFNLALERQVNPIEFFQNKIFVDGLQATPNVINIASKIRDMDLELDQAAPYVLRFWYKRRGSLYLRQHKTRDSIARKVDIKKLESPACIIFQSAVHPKDVPAVIKNDFIGGKHTPARFDDTDAFKRFLLSFQEGYGVVPSEIYADYSRRALEDLIGLLGDPTQESLSKQAGKIFSEESIESKPSGASPLTAKSQAVETEDAGSLADIVRAQQPLFSIEPQGEYELAYTIPKEKKDVVRLMKKMILGGRTVAEEIQRSLKAQDMMQMVSNVLRVQPSPQSVQLIKSLSALVGEEGKEDEFMQLVEKLAEINPFTMFYVNTNKIDLAEKEFVRFKDKGIQNITRADTTLELAKNLVQHGGFGVVISGLEIEGSSQYMLDLSINRRTLFHVDPLWNLARWRSASEHSDYNQHNYLMNVMESGTPIFIASQDRFFAENGDFDPRSESLAVRIFKDKAIKRPWVDYPESGKNISEEHVKKVERYTTNYRAKENIINGTFMVMVHPNEQGFILDLIEEAQAGDYESAKNLKTYAYGFANNLRARYFITQEGLYDRAISDAQQGNVEALDFLMYSHRTAYPRSDYFENLPISIVERIYTFLKTMDVEPYKNNLENRNVQWNLDYAAQLGNTTAKKILETQSSSAVGGIDLNAANLELKRTGSSPIQFNLPPQWQGVDLENVSGFVPVIINIVPIYNFQGFLGMGEDRTRQDFVLSKG